MKMLKRVGVLLLCMILTHNVAYASDRYNAVKRSEPVLGQITRLTNNSAQAMIQPRGMVLALSTSAIYNEGKGIIGIQAITYCHVAVDRIRTRIYLEWFDEEYGGYRQIENYEFDYYAEDFPEKHFSEAIISFDVEAEHVGDFYRVRATHVAFKDGTPHTAATTTDGIRITYSY